MKKKSFTFEGFGFPVRLIRVPLKKMAGEWVVDIEMQKLEEVVLNALVHKPMPLTSGELRCMRKFLEMTTKDFAQLFAVKKAEVEEWEMKNIRINFALELCIRLYVLNEMGVSDKEFRKSYQELSLNKAKKKSSLLRIDASTLQMV